MRHLIPVRQISLGCALLVASFSQSFAAGEVVVTAGLECNAVTPLHAKRAEWREYGIINKDTTKDLWVSCPLDRIDASSFSERHFSAALSVFNIESSANSTAEISCYLKEMLGSKRVSGNNSIASVDSGQQTILGVCDLEPKDWTSSFIWVCRLPAGAGISSLMTESHLPGISNSLLAQQLANSGITCGD